MSYNGITSAFQADDRGSIPLTRSKTSDVNKENIIKIYLELSFLPRFHKVKSKIPDSPGKSGQMPYNIINETKRPLIRFIMLENEKNYIREAQGGKRDSFAQIYNHYVPQIFRFVLFKVSSWQTAEDLTHEIFLSAWQNIKNYTQKEFPISSWIYQIARNKVIDHYRTNKKNISIDTEVFSEESIGFYEQKNPDIALNVEKIKSLIKLLKPEYQDVIIMRYIEDLDHKAIAGALKKSEGAVRLIQHRAINALKELYKKHGGNY